ncbi:hypothetical protein OG689_10990 [Kitasatospora sp. NBC_00240]|uniref:hypothetical protein n=1 Tax=Kitasatospora sp. NBC_00240 TaxID=2903567 RepID=UPI00224EACA3|nr:hypothetical protein [Kitasatospora sp. NBC_00240]MCX5209810.1 hypothetical protein [Kitasatospora sp. NBC_00240]
MTTAYAWAPITKTVREDDGTLLVYGPAASSALDRDQQRLDSTWLDSAMPRWMAEGGGVREQHDSKRAVGVGVGLSKGDDGTHLLAARIVDPVAVKKIEHGVLRGFSVGIKNPRIEMGKADAPNGLVIGGDVIEVSVVDRPANPECRFDMAKADSAGDLQLVEDAQVVEKTDTDVPAEPTAPAPRRRGNPAAALPDGSLPISTKADLRKAISADSGDDTSRAHIVKRAAALGLEGLVPSNWTTDEEKAALAEKAEAILRDVRTLLPDLAKADATDETSTAAAETDTVEAEASDVTTAGEAIAAIAKLIISEAESLAAGNLGEACDIELLLDAVRSLRWFQENERYEETAESMELADTAPADTTKADDTEPTPQTPAAPQQPDFMTKADVTDLVKSAVAEANNAAQERIDVLAADLAKAHGELEAIKAQPVPGGPVLTRTSAQQGQARTSDADRMRIEAAQLMAKADLVNDRTLRDGYIERANTLLSKADA